MTRSRLRTWTGRAGTAVAAGLAAAGTGLPIVAWQNRGWVTQVGLSAPGLTAWALVTPRHVDVAAWRTAERDPRPGLVATAAGDPFVHARPVGHGATAFSRLVRASAERRGTAATLATSPWSWRVGAFAYAAGDRGPPAVPSYRELFLPTGFVVAACWAPLTLVAAARRVRRRPAVG